jgi:hypothetical protein
MELMEVAIPATYRPCLFAAAVVRRPDRRRRVAPEGDLALHRPGAVPTRAVVRAGCCAPNTTYRRRDCHLRRRAPAA